MVYEVYILYSKSTNKYYVGQTEDLDIRLVLHNTGQFEGSSTKFGIPWIVYHTIECESRKQALAVENHIKKMKSVKYYQSLKLYPEIAIRLKEKYSG
jgi:putative endonuclease